MTIRGKLLPKRIFMTFDDKEEAEAYGQQLDQLLAAGVVPAGLIQPD